MRVLILTVGTRGDVQPYVALGRGLRAAGHEVTLCTCPRFEGFVTEHGLDHAPLDDGLLQLLESDVGRRIIENLSGVMDAIRTVAKVIRLVGPIQQRMIRDGWNAALRTRPDVIVHHPKMFYASHFAAALGIPTVLAILYPMHVPTGAFPFMGLPRLPLGRLYNRGTYHLAHALTRTGSRRSLGAWRREHDPEGRSRRSSVVATAPGRAIPVLHGYSPRVCPAPPDWPDDARITGYWFLPSAPDWSPPGALASFLEAGPPPVYIGFGSMAGSDPAQTTRIVLEAVEAAGVRAVLSIGWGGLTDAGLPANAIAIEAAPHDRLFPRMSAVIHHGGAGTTAAGLRAGRPTVICPFALDQPFWGRIVHELGVGVEPIPQKELSAPRLAAAIRQAVGAADLKEKARSLGVSIRAEDGVCEAVAAIEAIQAAHPRR